jgi:deoxyribonuclease-4
MSQTKNPLLLGSHISIAGGPDQSIHRGESIGCTAIQIFTKSNRQWLAKPLSKEAIEAFKYAWKQSKIHAIIAHAAYLINLGSSNPNTMSKSADALSDELKRCAQLGIPYLVLHPGSRGEASEEHALEQITQQLDAIFHATPGNNTMILLETMAGQGTNLCYRLEQIASIYQASHYKERLGVCLDTCHIFAAGYDLRTLEGYQAFWKQFNDLLGLDLLKVIHINDSKKALGSRADRHEHIGKGAMGLEAFRLLFTDSRFSHIPKILETPKESLEDDARNMAVIRALL